MWSLFSRDPASSFGYEILDYCPGLEERSIWKLHKGKKKGNGEEVSIFVFDLKSASEPQAQVAKSSFKRMKTLRHPNILTYVDGLESDKVLYVVTQPVLPLTTYLNEKENEGSRNEFAISWGLHQVLKALTFLNKDCHLVHNNICLTSVYVNKAGEWLLGGLEYIYPSTGEQCVPPIKIMPLLEKYDPPERVNHRLASTNEWSTDMWGLGCLIWEVFNGLLSKTSDLKSLGKLPKNLTGGYATLVSANPRSRPNPQAFLQECRRKNNFLGNMFVDTMIFLEEIQIKDQTQKKEFLESLNTEIDSFPASFCRHKILPQLVKAFEFGDAGANILTPLLKVGKLLQPEEYQQQVVPCVVKMFNITDRATRVKLLQQMNMYIEHIPIQIINDQLFPSIVLGFNDTNPLVRETTIKAMLNMASRLNYKNLNDELMKHFARLQSKDDQGGIRTNTTICLGKIACYLNPQIRQKVLPSAFTRAIRDPFPPARQASLLAMQATVQFFPIQDLGCRLLPSICPLTRDPEKTVRDQAFAVLDVFVERLKKVSEDPECLADMEKDLTSTASTVTEAQSWGGWAVSAGVSSLSSLSSLTSKFKGRQGTPTPNDDSSKPSAAIPADKSSNEPSKTPDAPASGTADVKAGSAVPSGDGWQDDGDGWNDEDNWEPIETQSKNPQKSKAAWEETTPAADEWGSGWDDSNWANDANEEEFEPIEPSGGLASASSYNWDSHTKEDKEPSDFFSTIDTKDKPAVKTKPAQSTVKVSSSASDSGGWDDGGDWGSNDDWGKPAAVSATSTEAALRKKEREEKRQERQKAIAEKKSTKPAGKPMKLGAKKLAAD